MDNQAAAESKNRVDDRTLMRRPYRSPKLTVYGSIAKLTQGPGGSIADGASGMSRPDMG
jgi:hypothetical protein